MILAPRITDHALLRWMERAHGIDIDSWRELMRDDLRAALDAHTGAHLSQGPAFILTPDASAVVTFLGSGQRPSPYQRRGPMLAPANRFVESGS